MAMEILSYNSAPCCYVVNLNWDYADKSSRFPNFRNHKLPCARLGFQHGSVAIYTLGRSSMVNLRQQGASRLSDVLKGSRHFDSKVFVGSYDNGYVIDGEEARDMSGTEGGPSKLIIPGLPDESNRELGAPISSCFWEWKPKLKVHYEKAGFANVDSPNVLFLPGFGVGSFHYEKQLKDLGREYRVWAVDFLGQGMSLPFEDPTLQRREGRVSVSLDKSYTWGFGDETETWASELAYSIDLWKDQVRHFIEEVIGERVYVVGNSLGGYVALYFAASYPHLVKGVTLLNATPFWGFLPNPVRSPRLAKIFPWAGKFPLPTNVRRLTELVWQKISDPRSIAEVLKQVYADHSTKVDDVFSRIVETTRHPAAAASFASIMFAPQGELSFTESLSRCQENNVPICLMYGKEDPWVRPVWGLKVKQQVPNAPYYEISPAGHCPHDEVPEVVNFLLDGWIKYLETQGSMALPLLADIPERMRNPTKELEFIRGGSKKSVNVKLFGSNLSLWDLMRSYIITQLGKVAMKSP